MHSVHRDSPFHIKPVHQSTTGFPPLWGTKTKNFPQTETRIVVLQKKQLQTTRSCGAFNKLTKLLIYKRCFFFNLVLFPIHEDFFFTPSLTHIRARKFIAFCSRVLRTYRQYRAKKKPTWHLYNPSNFVENLSKQFSTKNWFRSRKPFICQSVFSKLFGKHTQKR